MLVGSGILLGYIAPNNEKSLTAQNEELKTKSRAAQDELRNIQNSHNYEIRKLQG